MKNKSVFYLLLVGLLSVGLMLAACGHTTKPNDGIRTIPHDLVLGSANCIACHTGGLHPAPADHTDLSVELCSEPVCHAPSGTPPTTTMPSEPNDGIRTIPHDLELVSADCLLCHTGGPRPVPADHAEFPVESCAEPACHAPSGAPPPTAPNIPHTPGGTYANCLMCHANTIPADHSGYTNDTCLTCHEEG